MEGLAGSRGLESSAKCRCLAQRGGSVDREIDQLTGQQLENYLEADEVMEEAGEEQDSHDGTEPSGFYQELLEVPPRCISPFFFACAHSVLPSCRQLKRCCRTARARRRSCPHFLSTR